jgi:hypothetical protein
MTNSNKPTCYTNLVTACASEKVAPPIGLGPMTDWLTASRSTELSYGGTQRKQKTQRVIFKV